MKQHIALLVAVAFLAGPVLAVDATQKAHYAAAKKSAASRYADDKKLCADESTSSTRMQCLRDAKAEYDMALVKARDELSSPPASSPTLVAPAPASTPASSAKVCADCGKVLSVKVVEKEGKGGPVGLVAGGVAGAVLGHQVGKGTGKDLATIAGAAGGAYAGHKIEQKMKSVKVWQVAVRFDDGNEKTFNFNVDPGFAAGSEVRAHEGSIVRQ